MQKYTAIILSSRDTNEYDRIYLLYTKEAGLVRAAGKSVRKPAARLAGHLEPGTHSEIYIARSRGLGQITGAIAVNSFENARSDFERLQGILEIFKFFSKNFSEGEKDERIFELLRFFLEAADKADFADKANILTEAFWWKLFDALGQKPEVINCTACRKKLVENSEKFFSAQIGGAICAECQVNFRGHIPINNNQIKLLRIIWSNPLGKIKKVKIAPKELEELGRIREAFERYNF